MSHFLQIIKKALITERATNLRADANQFVFRVAMGACKGDIKRAVEDLFKVDVRKVRTMRVQGKFRRAGNSAGAYRPDWKKAIVSLKAGQEIKTVEEAQ
jgi:large subunit ribosomal protein L23